MPFDLEGARKAGYSDAEIAQFMSQSAGFDLAGAKKAGYSDGEVIAHLNDKPMRTGAAAIPTAADAAGQPYTPPAPSPKPEKPGFVDRLVGPQEAALSVATGATGGMVGMAGGFLKGIAQSILDGTFGTPEAEKMVEQAATEGARALTYQPRTQTGQDLAAKAGDVAKELVPVAGLAPEMAGLQAGAEAAAPAVAATAAAGADAASRVAQMAGKTVSTLPRRALEAIKGATPDASATPGTMGSVGAAATDAAIQRRAVAADLPVPIQLTKGQATRDPAQLKFEVETAKLPDAGAPIRDRYVQQNDQILRNFDAWIDQTGAEAPNLRAVGQSVDSALVKQAASDKAQIRSAYKAADQAGELEQPVTLDSLVQHLNDSAPDAATAPLLDVARRRALQLGIASEDASGQLIPQPTTLKRAETFRQAISRATDYEATNVRQATIMKGLIDESTDGLGGNLYKQARAMRARYAQNYEDRASIAKLLETRRGTADRRVAFEDVFDHTILKGSLDDVRNVRRVLQRSGGDGSQAWRDLQGQTAKWIKEQAERNSATDSLGNRVVSADGLDKAIKTLDADGRLDFIFGKQGAQKMRDIRDLAQIAKTVPPEAAVNTSNTASALMVAIAETGGTAAATGIPLPIYTGWKAVRAYVKDRALRNRIDEALNDLPKRAPSRGGGRPVQAPPRTFH